MILKTIHSEFAGIYPIQLGESKLSYFLSKREQGARRTCKTMIDFTAWILIETAIELSYTKHAGGIVSNLTWLLVDTCRFL